jgi:hypothetical protein
MVNAVTQPSIDTCDQVSTIDRTPPYIDDGSPSLCSDEKLLQFLMSKDFTARYAGDDDQYEEERYLQERHQNLPPKSLIEQMVSRLLFAHGRHILRLLLV